MWSVIKAGGPVMAPLLLLSTIALAIVLERLWVLRTRRFISNEQASHIRKLLELKRFSTALEFCRLNPGPFTALVGALVENRLLPYDELKEILEDVGRRQLADLERGLRTLGTIVSGAPLLGLLGTVLGMIKVFNALAVTGTQHAETLAHGIAEALITTAAGLIIAIPTLFAHSYLEGRAEEVLGRIEAQLLEFLHLVRSPSPDRNVSEEPPDLEKDLGS